MHLPNILLLLFLCTVTSAATNYVRGAISLLGSSGAASSFPAAQAVAMADEMLSLFNQTSVPVLSVEVEAADAAIEKANAVFILFSVEGETATDADAIFAAFKVPILGETDKVTSQFVQRLSEALRKNDAFERIENVLSLDLSTIIPLEKWRDDSLSSVPPPAPGSAPVRQKQVTSNSTKSDEEKSKDLDTTTTIYIGIASGSILLLVILVGLVVARAKAKKGAALRLKMEKEPLLQFLPGTKHATERELINIFTDYDGNGSKQIDLEELMALMNEQLMVHGLVLADQDLSVANIKVIMRALDTGKSSIFILISLFSFFFLLFLTTLFSFLFSLFSFLFSLRETISLTFDASAGIWIRLHFFLVDFRWRSALVAG